MIDWFLLHAHFFLLLFFSCWTKTFSFCSKSESWSLRAMCLPRARSLSTRLRCSSQDQRKTKGRGRMKSKRENEYPTWSWWHHHSSKWHHRGLFFLSLLVSVYSADEGFFLLMMTSCLQWQAVSCGIERFGSHGTRRVFRSAWTQRRRKDVRQFFSFFFNFFPIQKKKKN